MSNKLKVSKKRNLKPLIKVRCNACAPAPKKERRVKEMKNCGEFIAGVTFGGIPYVAVSPESTEIVIIRNENINRISLPKLK